MVRSPSTLMISLALFGVGCFDASEVDGGAARASEDVQGCPAEDVDVGATEGALIRDPRFKDRHGDRVSLYDSCGKITVLSLGAGWCIGCRAEMPEFVQWQDELDEDLSIYYVLWQDDATQPASSTFAGQWADQYAANFPIVTDPTGHVRATYASGLDLPATLLLDRHMVIRKIRFYPVLERRRADIEDLIAE